MGLMEQFGRTFNPANILPDKPPATRLVDKIFGRSVFQQIGDLNPVKDIRPSPTLKELFVDRIFGPDKKSPHGSAFNSWWDKTMSSRTATSPYSSGLPVDSPASVPGLPRPNPEAHGIQPT